MMVSIAANRGDLRNQIKEYLRDVFYGDLTREIEA